MTVRADPSVDLQHDVEVLFHLTMATLAEITRDDVTVLNRIAARLRDMRDQLGEGRQHHVDAAIGVLDRFTPRMN